MNMEADHADEGNRVPGAREIENIDFSFLPKSLVSQCQALIESFHDLHGYSCLPDILWRARLGPFIERHGQLRQLLRKASMTRSAKKSNAGFVGIATAIMSLEILASRFAGWSSIYQREADEAREILKTNAGSRTPLIEFYLNPPKYPNSSAVAALALPRTAGHTEIRGAPLQKAGRETAVSHLEAI